MELIDDSLLKNEQIVYRTHPSLVVFAMPVIFFIISMFLASIKYNILELSLICAIVGIVTGASSAVTYFFSEFAVTTRRVISRRGLLNRNTIGIVHNKIESVDVQQTILGRILGYGTVTVRGTGGTGDVFFHVEEPFNFRNAIQTISVE